MRNVSSYFIILVVGFALAACGGYKAVDDDIVVESVGGLAGSELEADDISTSGLDDGSSLSISGLDSADSIDGDGDASLLNYRVIYFEFDSSNLTPESEAIIQAHAQYLNTVSGVGIILEGHADERGTREYNLALGENRAKAVFTLMQAVGLGADRIQIISYGEERPVSLGNDDSAWNLNRRVEILY
ncbi:peptidoglycan-associated lipoprotein Pal [Candidatus Spongiihabitans sp.]|uniref:peptidoglycan-associated lipoprotein Pal n=1 Tax=Candidatus Spongiihabitans sp. TaxID=3101308 RepID=UPI003C7D7DB9